MNIKYYRGGQDNIHISICSFKLQIYVQLHAVQIESIFFFVFKHPADSNNKIDFLKSRDIYVIFSCRWGATNSRRLFCPPNIILDLFRLLAIPYSC